MRAGRRAGAGGRDDGSEAVADQGLTLDAAVDDGGQGGAGGAGGEGGEGGEGGAGGQGGQGGAVGPCDDLAEGALIAEGEFGACAYPSDCGEAGERARTNRVCRGGVVIDVEERAACQRDTDGLVLDQGDFGQCAYPDACAEQGARQRTDRVCRDGAPAQQVQQEPCERDTDGLVLDQGDFGQCAYPDACSEQGARERTDRVCRDGALAQQVQQEPCERDTDGVTLAQGEPGPCAFAEVCSQAGQQVRVDRVCQDGAAADAQVELACARDTDGLACLDIGRCADGACACPDDAPDRCGDRCVDLARDVDACGDCQVRCAADETCTAGACGAPCGNGVVEPELGETCDEPGDGCVDCRRVGPDLCEGECDLGGTAVRASPRLETSLALADQLDRGRFGGAVAIDGALAVVGAPDVDRVGLNDGTAFVYRRTAQGWQRVQRLEPPEPRHGDQFGYAVAIQGDTIVVGAPERQTGRVYVFRPDAAGVWQAVATLESNAPGEASAFGSSVAISDGDLAVGSPDDRSALGRVGSVYIFGGAGDRWRLTQRIRGFGDDSGFGASLAVSGDHLLIGAPGDGFDDGEARVYLRTPQRWIPVTVLRPLNGEGDDFGHSVALRGGLAAVGAPGDDGSAYLYRWNGIPHPDDGAAWPELARLDAPEGLTRRRFGAAVALDGDRVFVGAERVDGAGAVFPYRAGDDAWIPEPRLAAQPAQGDEFGARLAASGGRLIVGALEGPVDAIAQVFVLAEPLCTDDGLCLCREGAKGPACDAVWTCGDGEQDPDEACDDGNTDTEACDYGLRECTVCDAECNAVAGATDYCGDFNRDRPEEECDDGNLVVEACAYGAESCETCGPACSLVPGLTRVCGDGQLNEPQETCDDGNLEIDDCDYEVDCTVCGPECSEVPGVPHFCGDGVLDAPETCDDGNLDRADNCFECVPQRPAFCAPDTCDPARTAQRFAALLGGELAAEPALEDARWGQAVAVDGDTLVVGADELAVDGVPTGAAFVFGRAPGGWAVQQVLTTNDGRPSRCGRSVAVDGDTLLVGCFGRRLDPDDLFSVGSVLVFERDGDGAWAQTDELWAANPAAIDHFGAAVALSGDVAVVGAPLRDTAGDAAGEAFVFRRDGDGAWGRSAVLGADTGAGDQFGAAVAVDGDVVVVGAPQHRLEQQRVGAAYVFAPAVGGDWQQTAKLSPNPRWRQPNDGQFGVSVAASGPRILVGYPNGAPDGEFVGAAVVFIRDGDGWDDDEVLEPALGHRDFGRAVALDGDVALVGATAVWRTDQVLLGQHADVYAFRVARVRGRDRFVEVDQLRLGTERSDVTDAALAIDGALGVTGHALIDPDPGPPLHSEAGGAWVIDLGEAPVCTEDGACRCLEGVEACEAP